MGAKALIIVLGGLGLAEESLKHVGFGGPVISVSEEVLKSNGGLAGALENYRGLAGDAGKDVDVVCVIGGDVLASHSPAPLFDQVHDGADKVYAASQRRTIGDLADRIGLTGKMLKAAQDDPAIHADVLAFRPGPVADELFADLHAEQKSSPDENPEMSLNRVIALSEDVVALPNLEVFDGFRGYAGPFVLFRGQADKAKEWFDGRTAVHTQEAAGDVQASGELKVKKKKSKVVEQVLPDDAQEGQA